MSYLAVGTISRGLWFREGGREGDAEKEQEEMRKGGGEEEEEED